MLILIQAAYIGQCSNILLEKWHIQEYRHGHGCINNNVLVAAS